MVELTLPPSQLSLADTSSNGFNSSANDSVKGATEGWIIVESNFKVYAYTDNDVQIALLNVSSVKTG